MRLLDEVIAHDPEATVCRFVPRPTAPFADIGGDTPAWFAVEHMAQCAAAHGGLTQKLDESAPAVGYVVGARSVTFSPDPLKAGREYRVRAQTTGRASGLHVFDCTVSDAESAAIVASGTLQVYVTREGVDADG